MKTIAILFMLSTAAVTSSLAQPPQAQMLVQQALIAVKSGSSSDSIWLALAKISLKDLLTELADDDRRKAFWINVYNAHTLYSLIANPMQYQDRGKFFKNRRLTVAGHPFSLDDIEHGILRRSRSIASLGYWRRLATRKVNRLFEVNALDFRIHFALNCGAKSCPPIAFYEPDRIEKQLNLAMRGYLKANTVINASASVVEVPSILSWFRGDFGGKNGIVKMLKTQQLLPFEADPSIRFLPYDWSLNTQNFEEY